MSDFENRDDGGSRRPSDALQDSLEELSRLADTLVDGLSDELPDDAPDEAAPRAESAGGESLHQALVDLDQLDAIDSPQKPVEVELEGDRGHDIDAHLDAELAKTPQLVSGMTKCFVKVPDTDWPGWAFASLYYRRLLYRLDAAKKVTG